MQDNPLNEAFMNEAWADMQGQLDQAMPVRRKRRILVWWWTGAAMLMGLFIWVVLNGGVPAVWEQKVVVDNTRPEPGANTPEINNIKTETIAAVPEAPDAIDNTAKLIKSPQPLQVKSSSVADQAISYAYDGPVNENKVAGNPTSPITSSAFSDKVETKNTPTIAEREPDQTAVLQPLARKFSLANSLDTLILSFTQTKISHQKNTLEKTGILNGYAAVSYEPKGQNFNYQLGVGWKQAFGKFYLRVEPAFQFGKSTFDQSTKDAPQEFASEAERDNSGLDPGTSFQPNAPVNEQVLPVDFSFSTIRLPLSTGLHFSPKWSVDAGIAWNYVLSFKEDQGLNKSTVDFIAGAQNASTNTEPFTLVKTLDQKSYWQGQFAVNYLLAKNWELQLAYQHNFTDILQNDQLEWNRNYVTLGLRYRINSYIFGKK